MEILGREQADWVIVKSVATNPNLEEIEEFELRFNGIDSIEGMSFNELVELHEFLSKYLTYKVK